MRLLGALVVGPLAQWAAVADELEPRDRGGERTTAFKIRNGGNFDFDRKRWMSTAKLTRLP